MRIYVDMDDVLCETAATLCTLAAREFGSVVAYEDVREFDLQRVFSLSDADMARFRVLSHETSLLASFQVTPGAVGAMRALRTAGHEVDVVTGRPSSSHRGTAAWLAAAGLCDFAVTYVDKYGRAGCYATNPGDPPTMTLDEVRARGYDMAIDDSPVALGRLALWRETQVVVFSRPWNRRLPMTANMCRAAGWHDVLEIVAKRCRAA